MPCECLLRPDVPAPLVQRDLLEVEDQVQVSQDGTTVWVHAADGSTVGRFSKRFGMDVHTTASAQLAGAPQCLHCTHTPAGLPEWSEFVERMRLHHAISIPLSLVVF